MVKKKTKIPDWVLYTSIIAFFVYVVIILPNGTNLASITLFDEQGNEVETQSLVKANIREFSESVFGTNEDLSTILLQSTISATDTQELAVLRATVKNPFITESRIVDVIAKKNGVQVYKENLGFDIAVGQSFDYASQELNLLGKDAQRNAIEMVFSFKSGEEVKEVNVIYEYFSLTKCTSDLQCTGENNLCDIGGSAGFGNVQGDKFCVKGCVSHTQCPNGQLCKKGVCGY